MKTGCMLLQYLVHKTSLKDETNNFEVLSVSATEKQNGTNQKKEEKHHCWWWDIKVSIRMVKEKNRITIKKTFSQNFAKMFSIAFLINFRQCTVISFSDKVCYETLLSHNVTTYVYVMINISRIWIGHWHISRSLNRS